LHIYGVDAVLLSRLALLDLEWAHGRHTPVRLPVSIDVVSSVLESRGMRVGNVRSIEGVDILA
jgi:hypothetical protein